MAKIGLDYPQFVSNSINKISAEVLDKCECDGSGVESASANHPVCLEKLEVKN
ncbi:unnamed protein product, partial [Ceratitis capitata]